MIKLLKDYNDLCNEKDHFFTGKATFVINYQEINKFISGFYKGREFANGALWTNK